MNSFDEFTWEVARSGETEQVLEYHMQIWWDFCHAVYSQNDSRLNSLIGISIWKEKLARLERLELPTLGSEVLY